MEVLKFIPNLSNKSIIFVFKQVKSPRNLLYLINNHALLKYLSDQFVTLFECKIIEFLLKRHKKPNLKELH